MNLLALEILGLDPWWRQALASPLSRWCLLLIVFCLVSLVLLGSAAWRLRDRAPWNLRDCRGTAMMEFVLIIPIALFLFLTLAQTMLVMSGNIMVHYAAFAATRSAIVQIPSDRGEGERPNAVVVPGYKIEQIRQAAAYALLPVAGRTTDGAAPPQVLSDGIAQVYEGHGHPRPVWIDSQLALRYRYAMNRQYTRVSLMRTIVDPQGTVTLLDLGQGPHVFGPREPITVRLDHAFHLSIPYVWPIFADAFDTRFTSINAHYTLINEGISPAFLPRPHIPPDYEQLLDRVP